MQNKKYKRANIEEKSLGLLGFKKVQIIIE